MFIKINREKRKPKPTMTISNSKPWIKLNQNDCESRFNLNWLRKSFVDFLILLLPAPCTNQEWMTISTAIAKIQQRKIQSVYLPQQQPLAFSHLQGLFWSLTIDLSYSWNKINAQDWFSIRPLLIKKIYINPTHNFSNTTMTKPLILLKTFINRTNKIYPRCNKLIKGFWIFPLLQMNA